MGWWQVLLVFVATPLLLFALITVVVWRFSTARVPDGLVARARPETSGTGENREPSDGHDDAGAENDAGDPAE
jgi:hypothetical protein